MGAVIIIDIQRRKNVARLALLLEREINVNQRSFVIGQAINRKLDKAFRPKTPYVKLIL